MIRRVATLALGFSPMVAVAWLAPVAHAEAPVVVAQVQTQPQTKEEEKAKQGGRIPRKQAPPPKQPPPVAKQPPPKQLPPPVVKQSPPVAKQVPPPVVKQPPPVAKQVPPPIVKQPPPVAKQVPPPIVKQPPPVAKQVPPPIVKQPPPVAKQLPPPVVKQPPPTAKQLPPVNSAPRPAGQMTPQTPGNGLKAFDGKRGPTPSALQPPTTPAVVDPRAGDRGGQRPFDPATRAGNSRAPVPAITAPLLQLKDLAGQRRVRTEAGGRRRITEEPGQRTIIRQDNRVIIRHNESERFQRFGSGLRTERRPDGRNVTILSRPGGVQVLSYYDRNGNLLERRRRGPDGREALLIDNRRVFSRNAKIVGAAALIGLTVALAAPRIAIPRERYIVDYDRASPDDLYDALSAPPIERLPRRYALEEIRYSHSLRERVRRVDLDTITFEFGSWEVPSDQHHKLERVARAIQRVLDRRPEDVFMVEGHTDRVGADEENLTLSDRRAESVAVILTEVFGIPPENLVTQGYGEQYPKVDTDGPERLNRRVSLLNITGLMADANDDDRRRR